MSRCSSIRHCNDHWFHTLTVIHTHQSLFLIEDTNWTREIGHRLFFTNILVAEERKRTNVCTYMKRERVMTWRERVCLCNFLPRFSLIFRVWFSRSFSSFEIEKDRRKSSSLVYFMFDVTYFLIKDWYPPSSIDWISFWRYPFMSV